jgi:nucleotide-binding universal stress UspA family protein
MFHKILVPLDGSDLAQTALDPALALARHSGAEVILLRVPEMIRMMVPAPVGYGLMYPDQSLQHSTVQAQKYLRSVEEAWARPGLRLRAEVRDGEPAWVIVDMALEERVDLIVMSSHGYTGLTRWMYGSVAEKVLRAAPCPVLVVRSAGRLLDKMLIPLDGSQFSERALGPGLAVADGLGASVTLLQAVPEPDADDIAQLDEVEPGFGWRLQDEIKDDAEAYLRRLTRTRRYGEPEIKAVAPAGPAAETILKYAETNGIGLIAMATHGRTGLRRWVYGSVAEKVLRGGCCSMLIVRPPLHELN